MPNINLLFMVSWAGFSCRRGLPAGGGLVNFYWRWITWKRCCLLWHFRLW